jgi:hypothetical protein
MNIENNKAPAPVMIEVTPELAGKWWARHQAILECDPKANWRNFKRRHGVRLAEEMREKRFLSEFAPLALGADGRILDGQHRIFAVMHANVALKFPVVFDAPTAWGKFIDCGATRTVYERLQLDRNDVAVVATLLRIVRGSHFTSANDVELAYGSLSPIIPILRSLKGWSARKKHCGAPVQAAILLWVAAFSRTDELGAIEAYLSADLARLVDLQRPALIALYKQMVSTSSSKKVITLRNDAFARTWAALTRPESSTVKIVGDIDEFLRKGARPVLDRIVAS